jgi:hypothetical protein
MPARIAKALPGETMTNGPTRGFPSTMITRLKRFLCWMNWHSNDRGRCTWCGRLHNPPIFYDGNGERWPSLGENRWH